MKPTAKQLLDTQKSGVYHLTGKPEDVERAAKEGGLAIFRLDVAAARGKKDFLEIVAQALKFPSWFGGNWDALHDCLIDLDWLPTKTGYVLVFENSEHFASGHKPEFDKAKAVLSDVAEYWKSEGRPFWAFMNAAHESDSDLPKWPN